MTPNDYPAIFGSDFAKRNRGTLVTLHGVNYDKYTLGRIGCPHPNAARRVNQALKDLGVISFTDLAKRFSPEDFVNLKGFGITAFYALTCMLRDQKIPVKEFYQSKVTVTTLQHNIRKQSRRKR